MWQNLGGWGWGGGGGESNTVLARVNTLKEEEKNVLVSKLGLHYSKEARCITLCHRTVQFFLLPAMTRQLTNSRHPCSLYQTLRSTTFTLGMHPPTALHLTLCPTPSKLCHYAWQLLNCGNPPTTLYPTPCPTTSKLWKHTHTRYWTLCLTSKLWKHTHTRDPTLCLTTSKLWKHIHVTQHYAWLLNCGNPPTTLYPTLCLTTSKLWKPTHTRYWTLCPTSKLWKHTHTRDPTLCLTTSKLWKHTRVTQHYAWLLNCGNTHTWPNTMPDIF